MNEPNTHRPAETPIPSRVAFVLLMVAIAMIDAVVLYRRAEDASRGNEWSSGDRIIIDVILNVADAVFAIINPAFVIAAIAMPIGIFAGAILVPRVFAMIAARRR